MATEPVVTSTNTEAEECQKPNPQDNPRNIALAEIAKTVAKQHEVAAAETAPSIDEEGHVTPAPAAEPPPETPAAEQSAPEAQAEAPLSSEAAPVELAPVAQDAIDPTKEYEVTVDGQKMKVPGKAIIDAGYRTFQKETAADFRLKMASELLREAEAKVRSATHPVDVPPPAPAAKTDADLANALQFGTPEQAAEALSALRGKGAVTPEQVQVFASQQARVAAKDELLFQDALKFVEAEYSDLLSNEHLRRMFFVEENRRRAPKERGGEGDTRPYKDLYKTIGEDLRTAFKMTKPAAGALPGQPTPSGTVAARQALKKDLPSVPRTAASRLQEVAAQDKVPTPSEVIARMAEQRGQTRLSYNHRK